MTSSLSFWGRMHERTNHVDHQIRTIMDGFSVIDVFNDGEYQGLWIRKGTGVGPFLYVKGRFNGIETNSIIRPWGQLQ